MIIDTSRIKYVWLAGFIISAVLLATLLVFVFPGTIVLPQTLNLGPITFRFYGLILATAALSGFILARVRAGLYGISASNVENLALGLIIGGFIGARVYHVVSDFELYQNNLLGVVAFWNGGLSIFGAVLGGFIGLWLVRYFLKIQQPMLHILDWLVPSVALGQAIGRFGNLVNYEAYGLPANLPWKMFVPVQFRIPPFEVSQFFHPLFLYEAVGSLLLLAVLLYLTNALKSSQKWGVGLIFGVWLAGYGAIRFVTELFRIDTHLIFGVRFNLVAAALMLIVGVICVWWSRSRKVEESINYE